MPLHPSTDGLDDIALEVFQKCHTLLSLVHSSAYKDNPPVQQLQWQLQFINVPPRSSTSKLFLTPKPVLRLSPATFYPGLPPPAHFGLGS